MQLSREYQNLLEPIQNFLGCATPDSWLKKASQPDNLAMLLIDHMICELKAAQTAMWLIRKYAVDKESGDALLAWLTPYEKYIYRKEGELATLESKNKLTKKIKAKDGSPYGQMLIDKMVLLIKEELHHFIQVLEIMEQCGIEYRNITSSRYAKGLMTHVKTHEPETLIDKLICGAFIEARSCERFAKLSPLVDEDLGKFYISLLRSEARHYQDYIVLAEEVAGQDLSDRIEFFRQQEAQLISSPDDDFKFHSGKPID